MEARFARILFESFAAWLGRYAATSLFVRLPMTYRRSVIALASTFAIVLLIQLVLSFAIGLLAPALNAVRPEGGAFTATVVGAYLLGTFLTAIAAGFALGRLVPNKPTLHVVVVACLSPAIGFLLAGSAALPHGWQIVGYGLQLIVIEYITLSVFNARPGPSIGLSTRAA